MEYVEKRLNPNVNKLIMDEDKFDISATIFDAELDPFICTFSYDECVNILTGDSEYIKLDKQKLNMLKKMIDQAERMYDKYFENEW